MQLIERIDEYGKPAWIALMVLGFIVFWPVGLAILAYLIWSGRMGCWRMGGAGRWYFTEDRNGRSRRRWRRGRMESSGNLAFDEYREETLKRLEEEQKEFQEFLDRLRRAKDKAEFDQFMTERRTRGPGRDPRPDTSGPQGGGPVPGGAPGGPMPEPMG